MRVYAFTFLRVLICALTLSAHAVPSAAGPLPRGPAAAWAAAETAPEEKSCRQGERTKAFGWLLVDYGFATAKYVVGLFLIPIGLLLVCVGVVVEVVEALACG